MRFSIVTPCLNPGPLLPLACASVQDQAVELEHIVQDGGSTDGSIQWGQGQTSLLWQSAPDGGMYQAINSGFHRATGDIWAWLNADEQYLPGTLQAVEERFHSEPGLQVLFADALVIAPEGTLICHRRSRAPREAHSRVSGNLSFLSCATFFRREVMVEQGHWLPENWQAVGDAVWAAGLCAAGIRFGEMRLWAATYTETGCNLSGLARASQESARLRAQAPAWMRWGRPLWILQHRLRRLSVGAYRHDPLDYSVYTLESPHQRKSFHVARPSHRWPERAGEAKDCHRTGT